MANSKGEVIVPFNFSNFNSLYTCEYFGSSVSSKGLFRRDDPLLHPLPILTLQLGAVIITSSILQILLKPFKQPRFVSHMLVSSSISILHFLVFGRSNVAKIENYSIQNDVKSKS
ncbi:hypothetical protein ACSBR2_005336 [Camellia fascicularis]